MSLIVAVAAYALVITVLYSMGMYQMYELIFPFIMLIPVYMYAKSNKAYAAVCLSALTLAVGLRYPYLQFIMKAAMKNGVDAGTAYTIQCQSSGAMYNTVMITYLLLLWLITTRLIKVEINSTNGDVFRNKRFNLFRNLMSVSVFTYIVCAIISLWIFRMKPMWVHIIIFELVAVVIHVAHNMYVSSSIKEHIKELNEKGVPVSKCASATAPESERVNE